VSWVSHSFPVLRVSQLYTHHDNTIGDRRAGSGQDFSTFDLDNKVTHHNDL
jgi:hypothetical protein